MADLMTDHARIERRAGLVDETQTMAERGGAVAEPQLACGCEVNVEVIIFRRKARSPRRFVHLDEKQPG